ncbi:hypothetical protein HK098_003951 [Nowakowskiella sp. JEL0407]|nr:hypothetical protein HK098_003951 [Nowakowskiella sp. JEL0407]
MSAEALHPELFACSCLNVKLRCSIDKSSSLSNSSEIDVKGNIAPTSANDDSKFIPATLYGLLALQIEHSVLVKLSNSNTHTLVLSCLYCNTIVFTFESTTESSTNLSDISTFSPPNNEIKLNPGLLVSLKQVILITFNISGNSIDNAKNSPKYSTVYNILISQSRTSAPPPDSSTKSHMDVFNNLKAKLAKYSQRLTAETDRVIKEFSQQKMNELSELVMKGSRDRDAIWAAVVNSVESSENDQTEQLDPPKNKPTVESKTGSIVLKEIIPEKIKQNVVSSAKSDSVSSTSSLGLELKSRKKNPKHTPESYQELSASFTSRTPPVDLGPRTSPPSITINPILRKSVESVSPAEKSGGSGGLSPKRVKFAITPASDSNKTEKKAKRYPKDETIFDLEFTNEQDHKFKFDDEEHEEDTEESDEEEDETEDEGIEDSISKGKFAKADADRPILSTSLPINIPKHPNSLSDEGTDEDEFVAPHVVAARSYATENFGYLPQELMARSVEYSGSVGSSRKRYGKSVTLW